MKIIKVFVGKVAQYVTFNCIFYLLKGKPFDVGESNGSQNSALKDKMDPSLIKNDT